MSARLRQSVMANTAERRAMKSPQIMHRHAGREIWPLKFYGRQWMLFRKKQLFIISLLLTGRVIWMLLLFKLLKWTSAVDIHVHDRKKGELRVKKCLTCTRFDPPLVSREVSDAAKKQKQTQTKVALVIKYSLCTMDPQETSHIY